MIPIRGLRSPVEPRLPEPPKARGYHRMSSEPATAVLWSPEREETLRTMWYAGAPASAIAAALGCGATRNAVVGKAHRLGLPRRANPVGGAHG